MLREIALRTRQPRRTRVDLDGSTLGLPWGRMSKARLGRAGLVQCLVPIQECSRLEQLAGS